MSEGLPGSVQGDNNRVRADDFQNLEEHRGEAVESISRAAVAGRQVARGVERPEEKGVAINDYQSLFRHGKSLTPKSNR